MSDSKDGEWSFEFYRGLQNIIEVRKLNSRAWLNNHLLDLLPNWQNFRDLHYNVEEHGKKLQVVFENEIQ